MTTIHDYTREIAEFARAVRAHLADLSATDVEELTEGLESDLAEKALDEELGDPEDYAAELRAAAGYPERERGLLPRVRALRARATEVRSRVPAVGAVLSFFLALRPAWWLARAWALYSIAFTAVRTQPARPVPATLAGWLILAAFVVLSVQWGRGRWAPTGWLRVIRTLVSVIALVALPLSGYSIAYNAAMTNTDPPLIYPHGLALDGNRVENVFAYDANGRPLTQVQLFDQDGHPLRVADSRDDAMWSALDSRVVFVPQRVAGANEWNVFPLATIRSSELNPSTGRPKASAQPRPGVPPFLTARPLTASTRPTPSPTPTP
jgi:hypothetical protein